MARNEAITTTGAKGIEFPLVTDSKIVGGYQVEIAEAYTQVYVAYLFEFGALEARFDRTVPENALIESFVLKLTARRASRTNARAAAELRTNAARGEGDLSVVIDFGTPRTVTSLFAPAGFKILSVRSWNGSSFASYAYFKSKNEASASAVLTSEVRSERLEVEIAGSGSGPTLLDGLSLILPDLPADLELRLEGDDVLWRHTGPAQASDANKVSVDTFSQTGERLIDLTKEMRARFGNPVAAGDRQLRFVLTSRAPGFLKIEQSDVRYSRIRRARLDGKDEAILDFESEGRRTLQLEAEGLPASAHISEVRLEAVGDPPGERRLPPVGPLSGDLAHLVLDAEHAAAFRLPAESGLSTLSGIRLPLEAGDAGAELRAIVWNAEILAPDPPPDPPLPPDLLPSRPIEARSDGASDPLTLEPDSSGWFGLTLPEAIALDPQGIVWAVLLVSRGEVVIRLGAGTGEVGRVMTGPPSGPFQKLPALFEKSEFAGERAPLRLIGEAAEEAPIEPLRLLRQVFVPVTPTGKGVASVLKATASPSRALEVESLAVQTVRLRNVDIVSTD